MEADHAKQIHYCQCAKTVHWITCSIHSPRRLYSRPRNKTYQDAEFSLNIVGGVHTTRFSNKRSLSVIHTFNGSDYDVVDERMTWPDAERFCFERGGHLTSIASPEENEFLRHFTTTAYNG